MNKPKLVIDCRMIEHSGIGTYLKNIVPGLIASDRFTIICLGYASLKNYNWLDKVQFIELTASIFSPQEQWELFIKIPTCTIYWSPNWNCTLLPVKATYRVVTIHDVYYLAYPKAFSKVKQLVAKTLIGFAVKHCQAIITVSNFSKKEIVKHTNCIENTIAAIPLAVSDDFANRQLNDNKNGDYFLFVGNVKNHKNLLRTLNAFGRIENKSLKFLIVGKKEGFISSSDNLSQAIEYLKDRIVFTGYVSDNELKDYYANAKTFVFPSLYEGFGLPILEAMKFSIPIIASNAASIPEVGGDAILYFNPLDEKDIQTKMELVLKDGFVIDNDKYLQQLAKFGWDKTVKEHENLFLNLIATV